MLTKTQAVPHWNRGSTCPGAVCVKQGRSPTKGDGGGGPWLCINLGSWWVWAPVRNSILGRVPKSCQGYIAVYTGIGKIVGESREGELHGF